MLNKDNQRELAYVVIIDKITPIEGADRVALAHVGGWTVMVGKDEFEAGDPAVYFEIDSKVPETERFKFLEKKHYKIKTQKYFKGTVISQGLLMPAAAFNWKIESAQFAGGFSYLVDENGNQHIPEDKDTMFLTKQLGVTYAVDDDNKRKAKSNPDARINAALNRHPRIAKRWGKTIKKNKFLRMLFIAVFGRKHDVRNWPKWVAKTDEERIENMVWRLEDKTIHWFATEKVDGSSSTFTMKRGKHFFSKNDYCVCSRNVNFDTPEKIEKCYYSSNIYLEMADKYDMENVLKDILDTNPDIDFVTIQGETYGEGVQKKTYDLNGHDLAVFNLIFGYKNGEVKRFNPREMTDFLAKYNVPCVPIISEDYVLPDTVEELRAYVNSEPSAIDNKIKEGIVFRTSDGTQSFKCVSPEFLIKFHA